MSPWSSDANSCGRPSETTITPDHLHHRRQPEHPVVGVVGGREPRVAQPRPADRDRGEHEPADARADVILGDVVGQLVGGGAERDDDRQVVEQLQRRRRAMLLIRVTAREAAASMRRHHAELCTDWGNPLMLRHHGDSCAD